MVYSISKAGTRTKQKSNPLSKFFGNLLFSASFPYGGQWWLTSKTLVYWFKWRTKFKSVQWNSSIAATVTDDKFSRSRLQRLLTKIMELSALTSLSNLTCTGLHLQQLTARRNCQENSRKWKYIKPRAIHFTELLRSYQARQIFLRT
jgi:hypothetical protein